MQSHSFKGGKIARLAFFGLIIAGMASCSDPSFKIKGEISGADDKSVILEKADFGGRWIEVDSTRTDADGTFCIVYPAPESPEIYRLNMEGSYIYVPIDSIDVVTVKADISSVGGTYTLSGTPGAEKMTIFENELRGRSLAQCDSIFKRKIYGEIIRGGKGDIMSYYVLTRVVDNQPLYNPENPADEPYFAAVATAYKQYHPTDPRTTMLESMALQARRHKNQIKGKKNVVEASETSIIDMEFNDANGTPRRLSSYTSNGRPTLLIFSLLSDDKSPEITREISKLYEKYKGKINFYQVCLDNDITAWHEASKALPWMVVLDKEGTSSHTALSYNVRTLPAFYIYNAKGELSARADSFSSLESRLAAF
jgi:hypothetical protein